jgi:CBS domain-containing protein
VSQNYKRWYDHDPVLLQVINLLQKYQNELKSQAEFFLAKIEEKVSKVMTKNPRTCSADILIAEAVNIMNNTGRGITNMFVVDGKKPICIVHIHDCLRAGVS